MGADAGQAFIEPRTRSPVQEAVVLARRLPLDILARRDAQVGDVHEGDAGAERALDGAVEGFSGDAGVGEVAVEEAGGAGYLVEGETAPVAGEGVNRFEDLEPERDQLFE